MFAYSLYLGFPCLSRRPKTMTGHHGACPIQQRRLLDSQHSRWGHERKYTGGNILRAVVFLRVLLQGR